MTKAQNNQNQQKKGKKPEVKKPEVTDFFTTFLSKKNRNLRKKMDHIQELEGKAKKGEELKDSQKDAIAKKQEVQEMMDDNDRILSIYLEAYSKKDENEPTSPTKPDNRKEEKQPAPEVVVVEKEVNIHIIHSIFHSIISNA